MTTSILDQFILSNSPLLDSIKKRYNYGSGKGEHFFGEELERIFRPAIDAGLIRYRENKSNSYRPSGEYIQTAFAISVKIQADSWQMVETGKLSKKQEFEIFARKILVAEQSEAIASFARSIAPKKKKPESNGEFLIRTDWFTTTPE